jgi:hypothetical protein
MKKTVAAGLAGLMMAAAAMPGAAQAGQREWATAGKILTGVVVGGVVLNATRSRPVEREVVYERPVYRHPLVRHGTPPRCETQVVRYCPPPQVVRYCPPPRVIVEERVCQEPIVSYLSDGRRLYQPRVHGHTAYLQIWSEVNGDWVSIKEYPSIW